MRKGPVASVFAAAVSLVVVVGAAQGSDEPYGIPDGAEPDSQSGLILPPGFRAIIFADDLGPARHIAVRGNGDVYVKLRAVHDGGGIVALRDETGDGRADRIERFTGYGGTGIGFYDGFLYASSDTAVFRYEFDGPELVPSIHPTPIVSGFPYQRSHAAKPFTFDGDGNIYVTVGAPSNACQNPDRRVGVPGQDPCPELKEGGGIWRFKADERRQNFLEDGEHYATGIRHAVALAWNTDSGDLFVVQHGRDQLNSMWPDLFTAEDNAELPAEEFQRVTRGSDFGWPYTYYDARRDERMVAPEYGGDGQTPAEEGKYEDPILSFPAHWAPNDLHFYEGEQFPAYFRGGAFVAFHGSWNRAPQEQRGFKVVFVPFSEGDPGDRWQVFADGFAGTETIAAPRDASHRPMGLAEGPDGSLYITDSVKGRVWKVVYEGLDPASSGVDVDGDAALDAALQD